MVCFGLAFSVILYNYERGILVTNIQNDARFASDMVMHALRRDMLEGRREEISRMLKEMVHAEGVREINIIGTSGKVTFSSTPSKEGAAADAASIIAAGDGRQQAPLVETAGDGAEVLRYSTAVRPDAGCFSGACHYHAPGPQSMGALQIVISADRLSSSTRRLAIGTVAYGAVFSTAVFGAILFIIYRFVTRPMTLMAEGMKRLASGDLDYKIPINTKDEIGLLASTFNAMATDIKAYRKKLEAWADELQSEVDKKTREITEAHEQMVGAEKLASLGRMAAGVAHELNNPLTGVLTFAHLLKDRTPKDRIEDIEDLDAIIQQTERCAGIIRGLLGFARKTSAERIEVNLNELIDSSISILQNQSKFHNIKFKKNFAERLPLVHADSNQLHQVILNIIQNAVDAMDNNGRIEIATREAKCPDGRRCIEAEIADSGPGIMAEHLGKIFEPFFTTKPVGKGTGLGLPVSYGIIKRHGGDIVVRSSVGKGTSFRIILPLDGAALAQEDVA